MSSFTKRTHTCGELTATQAGQTATLNGWLDNVRDLGAMAFFVIRDFYGATQAVARTPEVLAKIRSIPIESTLAVTGAVVPRESPNPRMPTGAVELIPGGPDDIEPLGLCLDQLPFDISSSGESREDLRLKYRFLDLRNPANQRKIALRSRVIDSIRRHMRSQGFLEIQTPILTNSSPEGARDYIVPSRVHPGQFYALPQAPQQYKQLLMVSGFDRYFQIAPCFRDEDARSDRSPGEFYQLDMEMAFADQEDVFAAIEPVLYEVFRENTEAGVTLPPFPRIPYARALARYGSDKPDLRNPLVIEDVTALFADGMPPFFEGRQIRAIAVDTFTKTRRFFDALGVYMKEQGASNAYWFRLDDSGALTGGIANALMACPESVRAGLVSMLGLQPGSAVALIAEVGAAVTRLAGLARARMGKELGLIDESQYKFCWVVDFPMYERDEETGGIAFGHNPFSMPQGGLDALNARPPLEILAYQYDIVCNGIELSSGAVRNYDPATMVRAFEIAGLSQEVVASKFPALYNAFRFGAPPHAGIAPGVDRMVMLLAGEPNIREVIAFPMNKNAQEPMMGSPAPVTEKQLSEVHIRLRGPEIQPRPEG
ncbi:MAG: aspartate--tRNA ligase [Oscillospiraceae bacterium]|jgi:aspartyl-tRNA synthetase|nr:aspartate--tRNA ligase [Oscillospiraceae bacterium]